MTSKRNATTPRRAARTAAKPTAPPTTAPDTEAADSGPLGAVRAALAASPEGATTPDIATAAGVSRPTATKALTELETGGEAQRGKGTTRGAPTIWRPATPSTEPAADTAGAGATAGPEGGGAPQETAGETDTPRDAPAVRGDSADAPAEVAPREAGPATTTGREGGPAPEPAAAPAETDAAETAPDPAVTDQAAGRASQITAAAQQVTTVLAGGDLHAALAGIEEIHEQATLARRELKAALSGRKAPTVKPGGLRELVAGHLAAYPDAAFTPHEIGKVLGRSSGAVANALDKLVSLGQATLANEKPRRFQHAGTTDTEPTSSSGDVTPAAESVADAA
jgi:hypothetical protein